MYPPTSQFSHPGPFLTNLQLFKTQNSLAPPNPLSCFSSKVLGTLTSTAILPPSLLRISLQTPWWKYRGRDTIIWDCRYYKLTIILFPPGNRVCGARERGTDWQRCSNYYEFTYVSGRKDNVEEYSRLRRDSYLEYKETYFFFLNYYCRSYFVLLTERRCCNP